MPHISLVLREIWDVTALSSQLRSLPGPFKGEWSRLAESHISRKTSEMWGTQGSWVKRDPRFEVCVLLYRRLRSFPVAAS
jgi:hypothetical protein